MWYYKSPIGTIIIKRIPEGYGLIINETLYEIHPTPQSAADNVYMHVTGCYEWDILDGEIDDEPVDLSEWERS